MSQPSLPPVTPRQFVDSPRCMFRTGGSKLCGQVKVECNGFLFCPHHDGPTVSTMRENGKLL